MNPPERRFTIQDMLVLIAGVAIAFWLVGTELKTGLPDREDAWLAVVAYALGGLSLVGPPLLLRERFRRRRRLRPGEMFWFCQGTAAWLLWPPVIINRVRGTEPMGGMAPVCFVYGTPLMALYVALTLLAGGWIRPRRSRSRRRGRTWTETSGLVLGLIWACTGLYVLALIYRRDLFR